ncbi:hypothetical protein TSUD_262820 [Trifolium subterraneum]|nr:hypothetical protein TSUD_262820 [Trifolium subterraneum]
MPDPDGVFSVNSSYKLLVDELGLEDELDDEVRMVFGRIWESPAPSKVIAFSWQLLYDRIPTRKNLESRGLSIADMPWECVVITITNDGVIRKGFLMIWHATLWSLWKARNNSIFGNGFLSPKDIVEDIKVSSWKWSMARMNLSPFMFYEWNWDPGNCLLR